MKVLRRYSPVVQTGCLPVYCKAAPGERVSLPEQVTLTYSDGSLKPMPVKWEPFSRTLPGVYSVAGAVQRETWPFPFLEERADPTVIRYRGRYYYMATDYGNGQTTLKMGQRYHQRAGGGGGARDFHRQPGGYMSGRLWAPEPHVVNGRLCVFFAAGNPHWYTVQCHVMVMAGGSPPGRGKLADASAVPHHRRRVLCPDGITLDMTCFTVGQVPYVVWAQRVMRLEEQEFGNSDYCLGGSGKALGAHQRPGLHRRPSYGWDRWIPRSMKAPLPCGEETTCSLRLRDPASAFCIV